MSNSTHIHYEVVDNNLRREYVYHSDPFCTGIRPDISLDGLENLYRGHWDNGYAGLTFEEFLHKMFDK